MAAEDFDREWAEPKNQRLNCYGIVLMQNPPLIFQSIWELSYILRGFIDGYAVASVEIRFADGFVLDSCPFDGVK